MFNFFKKKEERADCADEAQEKREDTFFNLLEKTPKLTEWEKERCYRLSVRRTVEDFIDQSGHAMDEDASTYQSAFTNADKSGEDIIYSHFAAQCFIGYNACALLKQNWLINNACTVPAEDAIAPGFKFILRDKEEEDGEIDLEELELITDRDYKISDIAKRLEVNKKVFGVALAVPTFRGKYDYSIPFNIDTVKRNSYTGWTLIEPYWVTPELDEESARNPASKRFFKPTWWRLSNGERVHYTQCIALINSEVPDTLKPTYYFGGIPLTQMLYQRVYASEKVANEAPMLAMTKRLLVMDANIAHYASNQKEAENIFNTLSWCRDNFGVALKNHGDQVAQLDTNLTDFDTLIMTQVQLVASIAQIPATKLLKTTPKGFNATGEYEQKDYVQSLLSIQNNDMKPLIDRHFLLLTKSKLGRVIDGECKFNPIDTPSGSEQAQVNSMNAQTLSNLVSSGIISAEEARENLQKQETAEFSTLDTGQIPNEGEESGGDEEFLKQLMNGAKKRGSEGNE